MTTAEEAVMSCLQLDVQACECARQCRVLQCGLLNNGTGKCALVEEGPFNGCWHRPGRPAEEQLSDVPEEEDAGVMYFVSVRCAPAPAACAVLRGCLDACQVGLLLLHAAALAWLRRCSRCRPRRPGADCTAKRRPARRLYDVYLAGQGQAVQNNVTRAAIDQLNSGMDLYHVPVSRCVDSCSYHGQCLMRRGDERAHCRCGPPPARATRCSGLRFCTACAPGLLGRRSTLCPLPRLPRLPRLPLRGAAARPRARRCFSSRHGHNCGLLHSSALYGESCLHNCNGRGNCTYGFCHCHPGWWGLDCSRSRAYGPAKGLHPPRDRPRVYIYDLPTWVARRPTFEYHEIYRWVGGQRGRGADVLQAPLILCW
jgi:hypothetical protein